MWPYSWKKHLIEFMYANGFVMAYPNLPQEAGYATSRCLEGVHTGSSATNPRIAPLVESLTLDDDDPDMRHIKERPAVRFGLAVNEWPVLDMAMAPSSLRLLSRMGQSFLNKVPHWGKHDYSDLLERWAVPQCILDRWLSAPTRPGERPKHLLYQPQYGVDNQMVAFTHASVLAASLGRTLIAPPLQFPSACATTGPGASRCNSSSVPWSVYFNTSAPDRARAHVAARVRAIIASEPIPTYGAKAPVDLEGESTLERIPLYSLSLQTAAHWLTCNDETLYFDGLYTNKLPTHHWPKFSAAVLRAHRLVRDHLGLQAPYTCLHLRNGDFAEACHKWRGQKWFETLEAKGFLCDVPPEELPLFANTSGGLVLSRAPVNPSLVERYGWRTSAEVATATRLQAGVDDPAVAAFVEQLLCADADDIVLNMFSTFSRHIARIRTERHGEQGFRTHYFKRSLRAKGVAAEGQFAAEGGAAAGLGDAAGQGVAAGQGQGASGGEGAGQGWVGVHAYGEGREAGEASSEDEQISMTRSRFSRNLARDLARDLAREEDDEIASAQGLDFTLDAPMKTGPADSDSSESDEEIASAQGYHFVGELS